MTEYLGKSCTHRSMYKTDTNASHKLTLNCIKPYCRGNLLLLWRSLPPLTTTIYPHGSRNLLRRPLANRGALRKALSGLTYTRTQRIEAAVTHTRHQRAICGLGIRLSKNIIRLMIPPSASLATELYIWTISYAGIICGF